MARGPATAVIEFRPRMGRPTIADDLRLEFAARQQEEQEMADAIAPLIRRARLMATGPIAHATVAALDAALARHARRWATPDTDAA